MAKLGQDYQISFAAKNSVENAEPAQPGDVIPVMSLRTR